LALACFAAFFLLLFLFKLVKGYFYHNIPHKVLVRCFLFYKYF